MFFVYPSLIAYIVNSLPEWGYLLGSRYCSILFGTSSPIWHSRLDGLLIGVQQDTCGGAKGELRVEPLIHKC